MFRYLINTFIAIAAFGILSIANASVQEVVIELNEEINSSMGVNISQVVGTSLAQQVDDLSLKRVLAIELNYKSRTDTIAILNIDGKQETISVAGDPVGYYLYRYTYNTYHTLAASNQITLTGKNNIDLHLFRGDAFIKSITISLGNRFSNYKKEKCHYRLDSIFGSTKPVSIYRYSHGSTKGIAESFACYKAQQACEERRYSKNLETCRNRNSY